MRKHRSDGSLLVQTLQHQRRGCPSNQERGCQYQRDPGSREKTFQIFLRPTLSLPPAASGALTTPSSKTLLLPRTIGFAESVTMSQIFTPLELWGWSWEPLCSGVLLLFLTCLYVFNLNPLPAPLPTSMAARQASTSGLSPSSSSHPYRSLSATAMSCLLCSR